MISERVSAERVFGSTYRGFYSKIQPRFPNIRRMMTDLTISRAAFSDSSRLYSHAAHELLTGLSGIYQNPVALSKAHFSLDKTAASTSTFTFIAHYLKKASKDPATNEFDAAKNVVDNFPAILLCTAHTPYPSIEGKDLIESFSKSTNTEKQTLLKRLFPHADSQDISRAVNCGFNPMQILDGKAEIQPDFQSDELSRYLWHSKKALLTYSESLGIYNNNEISPLWVFLMRDAHILYQLTKTELAGDKLELDVGKVTLATTEEMEALYGSRGFNIGWSKDSPQIGNYRRLLDEIGSGEVPANASELKAKQVAHELLSRERTGDPDFAASFAKYTQAQRILSNLSVPEQIRQLLITSGITEQAESGRPVVFIDTGFRGSLPLLLQSALSRQLRTKGVDPQVHVWLDYVVEPLAQYSSSHQSGAWPVSPLDGLVSLNRILKPDLSTELFTTPFDAERQARILRPYLQFESRLAA